MELASTPERIACGDCDAIFAMPDVVEGERVMCPRCGTRLFSRQPNFVHRTTALVFAAGCFFVVANVFPFLSLQADYRENVMLLSGTVSGLAEQGFSLLAAMVAVFTLAAPALLIGALLYVLVPLLQKRRLPWAGQICRMIHEARRWNMVEVFLLGVVVSLLKLGTVAKLTLGTSFWALVGLIMCLASALAAVDHLELWERLEDAEP